MSKTIKLNIPDTAEERVRREIDRNVMSRKLAMELVEPIQEAAARLFEMYLREAVAPLKARIRELEEEGYRRTNEEWDRAQAVVARVGHLEALLTRAEEYVERYADHQGEPSDGDCWATLRAIRAAQSTPNDKAGINPTLRSEGNGGQ